VLRETMTHTDFENVLDECLACIAAGETLDACLRQHPQDAAALRPLLTSAAELTALPRPEPSTEAVDAGRRRMLTAFREQKSSSGASTPSFSRCVAQVREFFVPGQGMQVRHALRFGLALLFALLVAAQLVVDASAGAIPGDPLYGVKRSWEGARLALTFRERDRELLLEDLVERRQAEVREMIQQGRAGVLDLEGALRPAGDRLWAVDGLTLEFTDETIIDGRIEPGVPVWVRAQVGNDGTLVAVSVRVRSRLLPQQANPGATSDDMPSGRLTPTVTLTPQHTPQPDRPPQFTETPGLGEAPLPEVTPAPAETRQADQTTGPAEMQETGQAPEPTRSVGTDEASEPDGTDEPDRTPEPDGTDEPDETPELTGTREPDATPEPGKTDEPEEAPEPTRRSGSGSTPEAHGDPQRTPEAGRNAGEEADRD
jgi:hypothetical protein